MNFHITSKVKNVFGRHIEGNRLKGDIEMKLRPLERTKKIGKYLILFSETARDVWTKDGTRNRLWYSVSVHLRQKGALIENGDFDNNRTHALEKYRNIKTVSDVHRYLHEINPTQRPLNHYDGRLKY